MAIKGHALLFITDKSKVVINSDIPGGSRGEVAMVLAFEIDIFMAI